MKPMTPKDLQLKRFLIENLDFKIIENNSRPFIKINGDLTDYIGHLFWQELPPEIFEEEPGIFSYDGKLNNKELLDIFTKIGFKYAETY